ncbi:S24 family peptidase [Caballeronia sp. S22]|uniref:S24 family peptidase n=1 Tax=Caballeronia sp. S22 TaxID=3137182 RepID=UPI003530863F
MDKFEKRRLRLIEVRDRLCGGAASSLAKRIGKSDSYVSRMLWPEGRDGRKRIGEDMVEQIEKAFDWKPGSFDSDIPLTQILQSVGEINPPKKGQKGDLFTSQAFAGESSLHDRNVEPGPEIRGRLPLISWVQAGAWESVVDNFAVGDAEEWLLSPIPTSKNAYYLRVRGVSMYNPAGEPSFNENDLVLVEPQSHAESGALVIVRLDDSAEATFKQLIVEDGKKYLRALNPEWPNRIIQVNGNATVCGVVKTKVVRY